MPDFAAGAMENIGLVTYPTPQTQSNNPELPIVNPQVAVPDFAAGAMENFGLVTYRSTALLVDAAGTSAAAKQANKKQKTSFFLSFFGAGDVSRHRAAGRRRRYLGRRQAGKQKHFYMPGVSVHRIDVFHPPFYRAPSQDITSPPPAYHTQL